jgi:seryl-tRNA synthetase
MVSSISVTYQVPEALRWDEEIIKVFVETAPYHFGGVRPLVNDRQILISGVPRMPLADSLEDKLAKLVADIVRGYRDVKSIKLEEHQSSRTYAAEDPFTSLMADRQITESSPGVFNYAGDVVLCLKAIDQFLSKFGETLGAAEEVYPTTLPSVTLHRSGYLKSFPHHALFVAPVRFSEKSVKAVSVLNLPNGQDAAKTLDHLDYPSLTLAPTVCYHTFNAHRDTCVSSNKTITARSHCHRFETHFHSLERLMTFQMREFVFMGTEDFVSRQLESCMEWFQNLLRGWNVSFQTVTASDPFFGNTSDSKRLFQAALVLKREVRLYVPATDRWIAVASFNNHRDSVVDSFGIHHEGGQTARSGCVGFGLERLMYCLYCAFGLNLNAWPDDLKKH